jgi:hypothetical protein
MEIRRFLSRSNSQNLFGAVADPGFADGGGAKNVFDKNSISTLECPIRPTPNFYHDFELVLENSTSLRAKKKFLSGR